MNNLDGAFQVGDLLDCLIGPPDGKSNPPLAQIGFHGVTRIEVEKAAGPMGWYAVAQVFKGDSLDSIHPLHMMETVRVVSASN